ncbi:MAG: OmpH family outer membrane protein [Thiocapsa sp.]|jgi:outer membrane protein|nr:OmpH family outer membrane protein [Thiocapsa sp.]MCG6898201.1 OmpH family outer membrane protein [Thiocapsa sp.]MCG6985779.1 OmpH family outer membrane protein [Thiocapsa sp.]
MTRPLLVLMLLLTFVIPTQAVLAADLGFVDMQKVLEESKLGKRLQEQLRTEFEPRGQEMAREENEIRELQKTLERDGALMSADQVGKKEAEIKTRIDAFQEKAKGIQQELLKAQQEKSREIIAPARDSIKAIANKKKLGMVVEPGMTGLLYLDQGLDITADVIKHLDANTD